MSFKADRLYPKLLATKKLDNLVKKIHTDSNKESTVDIVSPPNDGDIDSMHQLSPETEYPSGEMQQKQILHPELLQYGRTRSFDSDKKSNSLGELTNDEWANRPK